MFAMTSFRSIFFVSFSLKQLPMLQKTERNSSIIAKWGKAYPNPCKTKVPTKQTQVDWFAYQIHWLVSIWWNFIYSNSYFDSQGLCKRDSVPWFLSYSSTTDRKRSIKKLFWNKWKNNCARVFFNEIAGEKSTAFLKKIFSCRFWKMF